MSPPCPYAQHDDLRPVVLRRRSSSDLAKQKFGTMPLVPLHGDSTDATMLSANQTLVKSAPAPILVLVPVPRPCARPGEAPMGAVCALLVSVPVSVAALRACRLLHPLPLPCLPRPPWPCSSLSVLTPVRLLCF